MRAVRLLGRSTIPALVRELADEDVALLALVENLQRQDLSFWEEAQGYARLLAEFDLTQEELAQRLGKSQSTIANKLRLLRLPRQHSAQYFPGNIHRTTCSGFIKVTGGRNPGKSGGENRQRKLDRAGHGTMDRPDFGRDQTEGKKSSVYSGL